MSYAHHEEADFAASQLATMFGADATLCYRDLAAKARPQFSACASNEPGNSPWPLADGVISLVKTGKDPQDDIALEYKREAEGVHGLLTAIGQSVSYLHKGYNGSVIVIPNRYASLANPAEHVTSVLDSSNVGNRIGVFGYDPPDKTRARPFHERMRCVRPFTAGPARPGAAPLMVKATTQWAHIREGSTTRDCIYRYLQGAIKLATGTHDEYFDIDKRLVAAVRKIKPNADPVKYLSNTVDDSFSSRVWRQLWFNFIATKSVMTPYAKESNKYVVSRAPTGVLKDDDSGYSVIFEGRATSLKETIVERLNAGEISEDEAWVALVSGFQKSDSEEQSKQGARDRAHSYREDVDSNVAKLKWIDNEGRPTDTGYRFVNICERYHGGAQSHAAREYFAATMIQIGRYGSFLHYVHRLSEDMFGDNPLAFTERIGGTPTFTEDSYWQYLAKIQEHLVDELKVMRLASGRSRPRKRTLFQAELTFLRSYGFVAGERYRLGVGLPINWLRVHEAMEVEL